MRELLALLISLILVGCNSVIVHNIPLSDVVPIVLIEDVRHPDSKKSAFNEGRTKYADENFNPDRISALSSFLSEHSQNPQELRITIEIFDIAVWLPRYAAAMRGAQFAGLSYPAAILASGGESHEFDWAYVELKGSKNGTPFHLKEKQSFKMGAFTERRDRETAIAQALVKAAWKLIEV